MKKIILILSALLLITSVSFSQRNYKAGKLNVNDEATFGTSITIEAGNYGISTTSIMSSSNGTRIILFGMTNEMIENIIIPQTATLHGGSCNKSTAYIARATYTGSTGSFWLAPGDTTECDDFTAVSFLFKKDGNIIAEGGSQIMGKSEFTEGFKYLFTDNTIGGPMSAYGSVCEVLNGDIRDKYAEATHLYYPEINQFRGYYYRIDSVTYDDQFDQSLIWMHTAPVGQTASIHFGQAFKFIGGKADVHIENSLSMGRFPQSQDADFALDGTADFSGVVRLNYINDFDSTDWNYTSQWVSGDSILGNYDYPTLAAEYCKGDIIAKTDGSWSANIVSIEFGDFYHLHELGGHNTLVIHDGTDPGVSSGSFRLYKNPDLTIGGGLNLNIDDGVYIKAFRGVADPDVTGWIMTNANGTPCYVYPNATGDGLTVSTTKP